MPVEERGRRADEALEVLGCLFSGRRCSFSGAFTEFTDLRLDPPPRQAGGPPVWVAGRSRAESR